MPSTIKKVAKNRFVRAFNKYSPIYSSVINIILWKKSKGMYNSGTLIYKTLTDAGFKARMVDVYSEEIQIKSRLNIFLQMISRKLLKFGKCNIFIPNPEWDYHEISFIKDNIDCVIAKTKDCESIFKGIFPTVEYTSFSSNDIYKGNGAKNAYVHFAGKSIHKGTEYVINVWNSRKDLPKLYLYSYDNKYDKLIKTDNILYKYKYLSDEELKTLQGSFYFQICPSEYEGFGHQINEAKSAASIVFTTDAPPMNELISNDFGYLIKASFKEKRRKAMLYRICENDLYEKIMKSRELSEGNIEQMRKKSRESYLSNDLFFKNKIIKVIESYI